MPQLDGKKTMFKNPDCHLLLAVPCASWMNLLLSALVSEIFPFLSHSTYMAWVTRNIRPVWNEGGNNLDPKNKDE